MNLPEPIPTSAASPDPHSGVPHLPPDAAAAAPWVKPGATRLASCMGSSATILLWLSPLLLAPLAAALVGNLHRSNIPTVLIGMIYSALVILPVAAAFGRRGLITAFWLNALFTIPVVAYVSMFGYLPSISTIYVIMETKASELKEFSDEYSKGPLFGCLAYIACCLPCAWLLLRRLRPPLAPMRVSVMVFCAILALGLLPKWVRSRAKDGNPYTSAVNGFLEYRAQRVIQRRLAAAVRTGEVTGLARIIPTPPAEVHVCIIGESASRWHQQLYGYARATNPRLSRRDDLHVFQDVVTRFTHTAQAIPSALLAYPDENAIKPASQPITASLVSVLGASGFKTTWLSNQDPAGLYDNIATVIAQSCDYAKFNVVEPKWDGALLPMLDAALVDPAPRKVIFLHLMGSHTQYGNRYPAEVAVFPPGTRVADHGAKESAHINHYDNSITYTDQLLDAVIERMAREQTVSSVLYFSDHGEDVYDVMEGHLHTEQYATGPVYEIPFLLWVSPRFAAERPELAASLPAYTRRRFMTNSFTVSYLDLLGFTGGPCDPTRSLFSADFIAKPRMVGKKDYDLDIKPLSTRSELLRRKMADISHAHRQRLWAHRVNSLGKLAEAAPPFGGVEIDVVYLPDTGIFDVTHPPAPSIGLGLGEMLAGLAKHDTDGIWLDVKDMDAGKAIEAAPALLALVNAAGIPLSRVLVESTDMEALPIFSAQGFPVIWYSPTAFFAKLGERDREEWTAAERQALEGYRTRLAQLGITQVSGEARNLALLQAEFPGIECFRIWGGGMDIDDLSAICDLLDRNPKVACFLVRYKSPHHR